MSLLRPLLLLILCAIVSAGMAEAARPLVIAEPSAQELFDAGGCRGCHSLGGRGGSRAPSLDKVGARHTPERLRLWLLWPKSLAPQTSMPVYDHLSTAQIQLLIDYLSSLK